MTARSSDDFYITKTVPSIFLAVISIILGAVQNVTVR